MPSEAEAVPGGGNDALFCLTMRGLWRILMLAWTRLDVSRGGGSKAPRICRQVYLIGRSCRLLHFSLVACRLAASP